MLRRELMDFSTKFTSYVEFNFELFGIYFPPNKDRETSGIQIRGKFANVTNMEASKGEAKYSMLPDLASPDGTWTKLLQKCK